MGTIIVSYKEYIHLFELVDYLVQKVDYFWSYLC